MDLQEKYDWTNKVALLALKILKESTLEHYRQSLDSRDTTLFKELNNPEVGDYVLEHTSSFNAEIFKNIGKLTKIISESSFEIELLDGDTMVWTNAKMIKVCKDLKSI